MQLLRIRIMIYVLLLVPGLIIFFPILFGNRIFSDGDTVLQLYPAMDFFQDALRTGTSMIWNPYAMTGFVTAAGLMGGFFSKLNQIVYQALPMVDAYAWLTFLSYWLTSVFTFELVVKLGLKQSSALIAAFATPWMMENFLWAGNVTVTSGLFLFPLLLLFCLVVWESHSWKGNAVRSIGVGLIVGTTLHAYHFQWVLFMMVIVGAWALMLDWRTKRFWTVGWLIGAFVIAAVVVLPQYEWLFRLLPLSARDGGVSFHEVQNGLLLPGDLVSTVVPNLTLPRLTTAPGFFYVGAIPLLLFCVSWFSRKDIFYRFFALTFVGALLISFRFSPIAWLLNHLPIFSSFRALPRVMHFGLFCAVMMAAYGFDALFHGEVGSKAQSCLKWCLRVSSAVVMLFVTASVLLHMYGGLLLTKAFKYFESNYQSSDLTLPREHYYQVIERMVTDIREGLTFPHVPITVAVMSLMLGAFLLYYRNRFSRGMVITGVVVLTCANLAFINASLFQAKTAEANHLFEQPLVVEYLKRQQGEFRVITLFPGSATFNLLDIPYGYEANDNVELMKQMLIPNVNLLYGVDSLDYYDNLMDRRSARLLGYLGSDRAQISNRLVDEDISIQEKIQRFLERLKVASAYNVRYVISPYELEHGMLLPVFTWNATRHEIPLYLYELKEVQQRYYLTGDMLTSDESSEEMLWKMNLEGIELDATLIECEVCPEVHSGKSKLLFIEKHRDVYTFRVETETPQLFVFGQNFLPGWRATVDGGDSVIYRASYVNQAVLIPSGVHTVQFSYDP